MSADEQHFQAVVGKSVFGHRFLRLLSGAVKTRHCTTLDFSVTRFVNHLVTGRAKQPRFRLRGDALFGPALQGFIESLGKRVLRPGDIAGAGGQIGQKPTVGAAKRLLNQALRVIHVKGERGYITRTGRSSTAPSVAAGQRAAQLSASSSEGSSSTKNPPNCSLVSA